MSKKKDVSGEKNFQLDAVFPGVVQTTEKKVQQSNGVAGEVSDHNCSCGKGRVCKNCPQKYQKRFPSKNRKHQ